MPSEKKATFNEVAALYDRVRNRYPSRLIADLAAWAGLTAGSRVLEIGAGTGIATLPLAELGCRITAIELGAEMAEIARAKLAAYPGVDVVVAPFEAWQAPEEPYDLVYSATAIHWIDPAARYKKPASLLRPGGHFAILDYVHVPGGTRSFFERVQSCYESAMPRSVGTGELPGDNPHLRELAASGYFHDPRASTCITEESYGRSEYLQLISTYSDHRMLGDDARERLFACIGSLIDRDFGGTVRKCYRNELIVAEKK